MLSSHDTSSAPSLLSIWAQGRRRVTPWAFPRLRLLAAIRFAVSLFLVGLGTEMLAHGQYGWAAVPLAGALLNFSIACLDIAAGATAARL